MVYYHRYYYYFTFIGCQASCLISFVLNPHNNCMPCYDYPHLQMWKLRLEV